MGGAGSGPRPRRKYKPKPKTRTLWEIDLPEEEWAAVRDHALMNGMSISMAITALFTAAGVPDIGFDPPPPNAKIWRNVQRSRGGTYFIPIAYAAKMKEWMALGYSGTYLVLAIIRRGLAAVAETEKTSWR